MWGMSGRYRHDRGREVGGDRAGARASRRPIVSRDAGVRRTIHSAYVILRFFFFFKQKTAYEIGLGIPAEPLFRSYIGATAKDISNVVTDAASGVVDIFHGIDKAVADTWNNFWKDGKADGIGSNLSRK